MVYLGIQGKGLPTATAKTMLPELLARLENNPFAPIEWMALDHGEERTAYSRQAAIKHLTGKDEQDFSFRSGDSSNLLRGSLSLTPTWRTLINLHFAEECFADADSFDKAAEFLKRIMQVLSEVTAAVINADEDGTIYDELALAPLPEGMDSVGWCHILTPAGYAEYFEPEDLRRIPAHRVTEFPDGSFEIIGYPNPFDYAGEEARGRMTAIAEYLNERRQDWKALRDAA